MKFQRYTIESIEIYYGKTSDIIIIGDYNDPNGPRQSAGTPIVLPKDGTCPQQLGSAMREMYQRCLLFTNADVDKTCSEFTKATGIKSWRQFAKTRCLIAVQWSRKGSIELQNTRGRFFCVLGRLTRGELQINPILSV